MYRIGVAITTNTNHPMNQSELQGNTCKRRQARENACDKIIGFIFTSDWLRKLCDNFNQSQIKIKQNQSRCKLLFTIALLPRP